MPYSHLHFNFGNYHMHFKQALEAADLFYTGLETSPYRYCSDKSDISQDEFEFKFNSKSCYAHTWNNLAVLFLLVSRVGHSPLGDLADYSAS